jgi:hypothetical protein
MYRISPRYRQTSLDISVCLQEASIKLGKSLGQDQLIVCVFYTLRVNRGFHFLKNVRCLLWINPGEQLKKTSVHCCISTYNRCLRVSSFLSKSKGMSKSFCIKSHYFKFKYKKESLSAPSFCQHLCFWTGALNSLWE